jgi:hypothetical protein
MSKFFSLNLSDFFKGMIMTVIGSVIGILYSTVQSGSLTFDWAVIKTTAMSAALSYLIKNLFTNSNGEFATTEPSVDNAA